MSGSETVDDADYVVTQSDTADQLNATVLIPDASSASADASSLTKDTSSFLRIGQYNATEEGDRSPSNMTSASRGVLIQTTGGLFFTANEDAYHEYKSNLDIHIAGNVTSAVDGNSTTTISGTSDVNTTGLSRQTGESITISTGSYTDIQPNATKDIRLKSDNKVDIESDEGVKLAVGSSHYAKISSEGLWETNFADAIDVTTGTTHSRFGGWTTEEYYGGSFEFKIAGTISLAFSISIDISLLLDISVSNISMEVSAITMGYTRIDIEVSYLNMNMTDIEVSRALAEVKTRDALEITDASAVLSKTAVKLATGLQIMS
ncbi:hypothetical protein ABVF61_18635 [Roseibium sp. HPY-6]|uniref:hypothetical protein n=1 Tax=Roseibium sp. HPY-6 TaxID=3229852 RepID=UPI00338E7D2C